MAVRRPLGPAGEGGEAATMGVEPPCPAVPQGAPHTPLSVGDAPPQPLRADTAVPAAENLATERSRLKGKKNEVIKR